MKSIPFIFDATLVPLMEYEIEAPPAAPAAPTSSTVGARKMSAAETVRENAYYTPKPEHYTPLRGAALTIECDAEDVEKHREFILQNCPYIKSLRFAPMGQGVVAGSGAGSSFHNRFGGARISYEKQAIFIPFLQGELAKGPAKITDLVDRGKAAGIVEATYHSIYQALHIFGASKVRGVNGQGREIWWGLPGACGTSPKSIEALATELLSEKPRQLAELRVSIVSLRGKDVSPKRLRLILAGLGAKEIPSVERGGSPIWRMGTSAEKEASQALPEFCREGGRLAALEIQKLGQTQQSPVQLSFLHTDGVQPSYSWKDEDE